MMQRLAQRLAELDDTFRGSLTPLSGGDSGAGVWRLEAATPLIVKCDQPERLAGEADGLAALATTDTLVVPRVVALAGDLLVMEALDAGGPRDGARLGEGLRQLHAVTRDPVAEHGWGRDNACGLTPQPNAMLADGRAFQRERRLLPLVRACCDRGLLDAPLAARIERVAATLESWLADQPPSLVHGDLWSGNVLFTPRGPAIIDPAVYRHYPDVDVAMLSLFGDPGAAFHEAYWDGRRPADWSRREALFQLYPLLNHLYLFGAGYRGGVSRAVDRVLAA
ncbi:fructosamine kinase family protein [Salinicola sp. RZ23]|uniref:fructosamine kinase family protein n=1 Tax=Salinicola sp. RZ23 TaxID=1949087 RepID=UPI000DA1B0F5|nr:fructosamine kinase family protein [Salinicola sp. RZ23]